MQSSEAITSEMNLFDTLGAGNPYGLRTETSLQGDRGVRQGTSRDRASQPRSRGVEFQSDTDPEAVRSRARLDYKKKFAAETRRSGYDDAEKSKALMNFALTLYDTRESVRNHDPAAAQALMEEVVGGNARMFDAVDGITQYYKERMAGVEQPDPNRIARTQHPRGLMRLINVQDSRIFHDEAIMATSFMQVISTVWRRFDDLPVDAPGANITGSQKALVICCIAYYCCTTSQLYPAECYVQPDTDDPPTSALEAVAGLCGEEEDIYQYLKVGAAMLCFCSKRPTFRSCQRGISTFISDMRSNTALSVQVQIDKNLDFIMTDFWNQGDPTLVLMSLNETTLFDREWLTILRDRLGQMPRVLEAFVRNFVFLMALSPLSQRRNRMTETFVLAVQIAQNNPLQFHSKHKLETDTRERMSFSHEPEIAYAAIVVDEYLYKASSLKAWTGMTKLRSKIPHLAPTIENAVASLASMYQLCMANERPFHLDRSIRDIYEDGLKRLSAAEYRVSASVKDPLSAIMDDGDLLFLTDDIGDLINVMGTVSSNVRPSDIRPDEERVKDV